VRVALPENDRQREQLPFYWYRYGPYSEVVESSVDALKVQGILREEKTQTGKSLLLLNNRPAAWGSVCEETSAVVGRMEREIDPYNIEALVYRIYREDAPYEFMPRYRLDYLAPLESCLAKHPKDQRTLNLGYPDGSDGRDLDRIEDALYGCEAVLLEEEPFEGFTEEFTAYVSGVAKAFDLIRNDDSVAHQVLEATRETAWETWYVFAGGGAHPGEGARCLLQRKARTVETGLPGEPCSPGPKVEGL